MCFTTSLSAFEANKPEQTFIVSFGVHNGPPFALIEGDRLVGGIIKDVAEEIANELNIIVSYVKVPRKRQENYLSKGIVHANLVSNPQWLKKRELLNWSEPLFFDQDVLVFQQSKAKSKLSEVANMTVGTIRGYTYPNIEKYFARGDMLRSDVGNIELNFIRLEKGWIDTFVGSNLLIQNSLKNMAHPELFEVSPFSISEHGIYAALSPNSPVSIAQFNQVLIRLKKHGVIDAILNKYKIVEE